MNAQTVQIISKLRRRSQSDLARMAGVSRQAVSHWFKAPAGAEVDVLSSRMRKLSDGLGVSADVLLRPLPLLDDAQTVGKLETSLLWDHLYPDLAEYAVALARGELPALARLAQVYGMYRASKIAGRGVWESFPRFKRHIRPVRREQLERVWELHQRHSSA